MVWFSKRGTKERVMRMVRGRNGMLDQHNAKLNPGPRGRNYYSEPNSGKVDLAIGPVLTLVSKV